MHEKKTKELPGLLVELAKETITKIQVFREPAQHTKNRDPEEEDIKGNQDLPGFKQIPSNFRTTQLFMSSPLAAVKETRNYNRGPLWL